MKKTKDSSFIKNKEKKKKLFELKEKVDEFNKLIAELTKTFGRPKLPIEKGRLEGMVMFGATCLECANEFDCDESTIVQFVKKNYKMTFPEFSHKKQGAMRVKLRQTQMALALSGNTTMLIWLGKQHLGQSEDNIPSNEKEVYTPLPSLTDDEN